MTFTVGGFELASDDPTLVHAAPEMIQVLFSIAGMLFAHGPLYVEKLKQAGPWTRDEVTAYLTVMQRTVNLLTQVLQPKGTIQ